MDISGSPAKIHGMQKRPLIMGILNLTPDSFSDGGKFMDEKNAIKRVLQMEAEGADFIDIGGESTGPNSKNVSLSIELERVIPFLRKIRQKTKLPISIDTYKAEVARQALEEGADLINDVTALRSDPKLAEVVTKHNCPIILMYSKDKTPRTTVKAKKYTDVIKTINDFFVQRLKFAKNKGIKSKNIILDPGMGQFISSIPTYSLEIIARLREFHSLKHPLLIGISRKSFLGGKMPDRDQMALPLSAIAYLNGASIIRTHDVKGLKEFFSKLNT